MPVPKRDLAPLPENPSSVDIRRQPLVRENLALVPDSRETFEERQARLEGKRIKYSGMIAHQEMAAMVLAAGGSFKMAATRAGISMRQVRKYYTEADFRARIEELRTIMFSKVRGRVIKELEKRTEPGKIDNIELLDLLRVFDRVAGPLGGKAGIQISGDVNVSNNYDNIINALLAPQPREESADFPIYEVEGTALPSGDSPE